MNYKGWYFELISFELTQFEEKTLSQLLVPLFFVKKKMWRLSFFLTTSKFSKPSAILLNGGVRVGKDGGSVSRFEGVYAINGKQGLAERGGQTVSFTAMGVNYHCSEGKTAFSELQLTRKLSFQIVKFSKVQ